MTAAEMHRWQSMTTLDSSPGREAEYMVFPEMPRSSRASSMEESSRSLMVLPALWENGTAMALPIQRYWGPALHKYVSAVEGKSMLKFRGSFTPELRKDLV